MWLNGTYNTDITCYRVVSYRLRDEVLLDLQQIIPLPEAKDFQIQQRQKGAATAAARSGRDYTRYDITVDGQEHIGLSKQAGIKFAIQELYRAGVGLDHIKAVTWERRWIPVHPATGETTQEAVRREHPDRSATNMWFDLNITEGGTTWVIPQFGGPATEQTLDRLAAIAPPHTDLRWPASSHPGVPVVDAAGLSET